MLNQKTMNKLKIIHYLMKLSQLHSSYCFYYLFFSHKRKNTQNAGIFV